MTYTIYFNSDSLFYGEKSSQIYLMTYRFMTSITVCVYVYI